MTKMTTGILNTSYWNNVSPETLNDFNDLFSSTYTILFDDEYHQGPMSIKKEAEENSSSSEIDRKELQISPLSNLKCGVCGAPATGYNFDQITCESCKAFFRRNAFRNMNDMRCRFTGSCVMNIRTRRQCAYCRLKKCFDIKMRKDWIRTDEERELRQLQKLAKEQKKLKQLTEDEQSRLNLPIVMRKKKRLFVKQAIQEVFVKPIHTQTFFGFNRNLRDEDKILLSNISNAYQSAADQAKDLQEKQYTPSMTLIDFLDEESKVHESLINFYKAIPQFNELDLKDRILLIKLNLVKIIHLHCILIQKFHENPTIGASMSKWISADFHNQMSGTRGKFDRFIENPLIIKLALIVFIFSINLSTPSDTDSRDDYYKDKMKICEIQDFYGTVLWRYLNSVYDEKGAIRSLEIITAQILRYQALMVIMEEHVKKEIAENPVAPLEASLFRQT